MRTLIFDQFEFDPPDSEEALEISIAAKGKFPFSEVQDFAAAIIGIDAAKDFSQATSFDESFGYGLIRDYLRKYADISLPSPCNWPTYIMVHDNDEWDGIIEGPSIFIRYHWSTSA
jgi:hypothetical protein